MKKYRHSIISIFIFSILIGYLTLTNKVPYYISILYGIISLVTFFIYKVDKSAAEKGRWRISENTLHLLSVLGGWPGAMLGQQVFNHKTKKTSFQVIFWLSVLLNIGTLTFLGIYASSVLNQLY
ncbi:DUF1294 domain-containing protein [Zooshikella sp. WH53]|uniref:DUF1294 domain-containing protein n=1 Tax=Zooshikella harenae TaxID=2827238 RepID=A0ABS5ZAM2_9GAMM|nr:DUF1294 domain-containing protein [Zooshikella harenae]